MNSRRILLTGLSSQLGGRLAQTLERDPRIDAIIGVDTTDPRHQFERTEFVRVDTEHARIRRIVTAAAIDTVVDTRLAVDPMEVSVSRAHEVNVAGTRNILEACHGVGKLVFKSSAEWYGCGPEDPAFFTEEMERRQPPGNAVERDVVEAERAVLEFAARNRETTVTVLRIATGIGAETRGSHMTLLGLPVIPAMLGFDPRQQFIHEEDIVGVLEHTVRNEAPGTFNAAADGVLPLSEVSSLLGKPMLPVVPPWGTTFAAAQLRRLGLRVPVELIRQLRYGRGLDNRRIKASGYSFRYTTREAVLKLRAQQRLRPLLRSGADSYRYEREVEEFLRWSPSVQQARARASEDGTPPLESALNGYDELGADELVGVIASMDGEGLARLREYEATHRARPAVLQALDRALGHAPDRPGFGRTTS
jgi:UDP-glucose 4-epimerase